MKAFYFQQGHEEWFEMRTGKVTASEVIDALSFHKKGEKKGGPTEARKAYMAKLVAEMLSGEYDRDGYLSQCMKDGTAYEDEAREAYAVKQDVLVTRVGFIVHPTIARFGASPDGIIKPNGGVELKAPKTKTHIEYMMAGILPPDYEPQVMTNIACAEAEWWDFSSYGFKLPQQFQTFVVRVPRDDKRIAEIETGVLQFLQEADDMIGELKRLNPAAEELKASLVQSIATDDPAWHPFANAPDLGDEIAP